MKRKVYIFNIISRAANYGIGTYINQLILCLKNIGIEFEVICLHSSSKEIEITDKNGYNQISIPSALIQNKKGEYCYMRNVVYLLKEFISEDKDILNIFHLNFMNSPELVVYLKKMFKCKVLLVAHYTNWSFSLLGDYSQLKSFLEQKSTKRNAFQKGIINNFKEEVKMIRKCDYFVCVARHTLSSFVEIGKIDIMNNQVIYNCLQDVYEKINDEEKFIIHKKYNIPPNTKIVFFAGRLDEVKGVFDLIKAFKEVIKYRKNVRLVMAGDGDFSHLISLSEDSCFNITFTGRLEKDKLYQFYNIANIGIVPSIHEEFGFVAIEMMMHALPIIVSDTGGLAEIVDDGISGLKVPIVKVEKKRTVKITDLVDKINFLLDNEEYARKLGEMGRKIFLEKYELSNFQKKMLDLYMNI